MNPTNAPLILVADDESHILHVVSLKLRNAGYEVITAADGEEGYETAIREKPDLIITDYQMPLMTGVEMCQKLREHPELADTPVLMLTARGFNVADGDLDQTNIQDVMSKPFSPREILEKVQELTESEVEPTP